MFIYLKRISRVNFSHISLFVQRLFKIFVPSVNWASQSNRSFDQIEIICAVFLELNYISAFNINLITLFFFQKLFRFFQLIGQYRASLLNSSIGQIKIGCVIFLELKYICIANFSLIPFFLFSSKLIIRVFQYIGKLGFLFEYFN